MDISSTQFVLNSNTVETSHVPHEGQEMDVIDTTPTELKLNSDTILVELTALLRHWNGSGNLPLELKQLITVWPTLPEHIKAAIMALIGTV